VWVVSDSVTCFVLFPSQAPPDEGEEEALKAFDTLEQQLAATASQQH